MCGSYGRNKANDLYFHLPINMLQAWDRTVGWANEFATTHKGAAIIRVDSCQGTWGNFPHDAFTLFWTGDAER